MDRSNTKIMRFEKLRFKKFKEKNTLNLKLYVMYFSPWFIKFFHKKIIIYKNYFTL